MELTTMAKIQQFVSTRKNHLPSLWSPLVCFLLTNTLDYSSTYSRSCEALSGMNDGNDEGFMVFLGSLFFLSCGLLLYYYSQFVILVILRLCRHKAEHVRACRKRNTLRKLNYLSTSLTSRLVGQHVDLFSPRLRLDACDQCDVSRFSGFLPLDSARVRQCAESTISARRLSLSQDNLYA